jgi:hypothetical protein
MSRTKPSMVFFDVCAETSVFGLFFTAWENAEIELAPQLHSKQTHSNRFIHFLFVRFDCNELYGLKFLLLNW